jgi:prepilin-type processing-associated H-X9-DG protein
MAEHEPGIDVSLSAKIFIAVGIIAVAAPVLYVVAVMTGLKAHLKDDCRMLLARNLGVECRVHAAKHDGQFPIKWSDLERDDMNGITNMTWVFACPTVGHGPGNSKQVDLWSDYRLIPGRTINDAPDTVLAIEPLSNHKTGANVLFVDGSSQWWPAAKVIGQKPTPQRMTE